MKKKKEKKNERSGILSKDWLEDPDFKNWLVSCTNNTQARCKLCQKTFNLSNMGRKALVSHVSGKKHKLHDSRVQRFSKPTMVKQTSTCVGSSQSSSTQSSSTQSSNDKETIAKQSTLHLVMRNFETVKVEIIWALKCVGSGYSNNSFVIFKKYLVLCLQIEILHSQSQLE